jgi:hypothetical protein
MTAHGPEKIPTVPLTFGNGIEAKPSILSFRKARYFDIEPAITTLEGELSLFDRFCKG